MGGHLIAALLALVIDPVLQPPPGTAPVASVQAGGVQVYACGLSSGSWSWTLLEPVATLFDSTGRVVGAHTKGPTWTALDGSRVTADGKHPLGSVARSDSIPELLLRVTDASGNGVLSGVRYVQRLDTEGGVAPADGCNASHPGQRAAVHYSAIYQFYK